MASVNISKWDIAQAFGLYYNGVIETKDKWGDDVDLHEFDFAGKLIHVQSDYYTNYEKAQEEAAEQVLSMIAKVTVAMDK
jgi:hypothetical protein